MQTTKQDESDVKPPPLPFLEKDDKDFPVIPPPSPKVHTNELAPSNIDLDEKNAVIYDDNESEWSIPRSFPIEEDTKKVPSAPEWFKYHHKREQQKLYFRLVL